MAGPAPLAAVLAVPGLSAWEGLETVLRAHKPGALLLVDIGRRAAGGAGDPTAAQAAVLCALVSSILVDDVLDEDVKGANRSLGAGRAANLAAALDAAAVRLLMGGPLLDAWGRLRLGIARAEELQARRSASEDVFWDVVRGKSGQVCGEALRMGGIVGGAPAGLQESLFEAGVLLGEIGQIANDLEGAFKKPANPDWRVLGCSLPILYAATAAHPRKAEFQAARRRAPVDAGALAEAQAVLSSCGAVAYCFHCIEERLARLKAVLGGMEAGAGGRLREALRPEVERALKWLEEGGARFGESRLRELSL